MALPCVERIIAYALAGALLASSAHATKIVQDGQSVFVNGEITEGDDATFASLSDDGKMTVYLSSPGGHLRVAMRIGEIIRQRGWGTMVAPGATCASACALIWSAGAPRQLGHKSQLRLHCPRFITEMTCSE